MNSDQNRPAESGPLRAEQVAQVAPAGSPVTEADLAVVRTQLGRLPRAVAAVGARCVCGNPLVVVTRPDLGDGTPFPTLFYLTSPELTKACSTLEAERAMEQMNQSLAEDRELAAAYAAAHDDYLARRALLGDVPQIAHFSAGGMPNRVKCLHALTAHSLAAGEGVNPVGDYALRLIAERGLWGRDRCYCAPLLG